MIFSQMIFFNPKILFGLQNVRGPQCNWTAKMESAIPDPGRDCSYSVTFTMLLLLILMLISYSQQDVATSKNEQNRRIWQRSSGGGGVGGRHRLTMARCDDRQPQAGWSTALPEGVTGTAEIARWRRWVPRRSRCLAVTPPTPSSHRCRRIPAAGTQTSSMLVAKVTLSPTSLVAYGQVGPNSLKEANAPFLFSQNGGRQIKHDEGPLPKEGVRSDNEAGANGSGGGWGKRQREWDTTGQKVFFGEGCLLAMLPPITGVRNAKISIFFSHEDGFLDSPEHNEDD